MEKEGYAGAGGVGASKGVLDRGFGQGFGTGGVSARAWYQTRALRHLTRPLLVVMHALL